MAQETGMLGRLTTHSIRRGTMRDVVHLPSSAVNLTDRAIGAAVADHSRAAYQADVTDDYIGSVQKNFYNVRADHNLTDELAPRAASGPRRQCRGLCVNAVFRQYARQISLHPCEQPIAQTSTKSCLY